MDKATPTTQPGLLGTVVNIFTSPAEAFRSILVNPRILFPLALLLIPTLGVYFWYFQYVDYAWFIDDSITRIGDLSEEEQQVMRRFYEAMSPLVAGSSTVISAMLSTLLMLLVHAAWLSLMTSLFGDSIRFKQWFSLLAWTSLPMLLVAGSMGVNILINPSGQLNLYDANALSLSSLGFSAEGRGMRTVLDSINLAMLWSMVLIVGAYRQWVQAGWLRSVLAPLGPYFIVAAIVAFFMLR